MIYLDSAATSLQKPEAVGRAMLRAMRTAASTGRGDHVPAMEASGIVLDCRSELAELFHVPSPEQVVFTHNATHGLNIAIRSLVQPGTRVLISGYEHNAVTRPLHAVGAQVRVAACPLFSPSLCLDAFSRQLDWAEIVVCTMVSNVFGFCLPVSDLAAICRDKGKPLILDASQAAGCLPLDFAALGAAFAAMPGHKGLLGPQGTGVLLCAQEGRPLLHGGSGSNSISPEMPDFLPDRLEAGTLNVTGIAGLLEGVRWVRSRGETAILAHERKLTGVLAERLGSLPRLRVFYGGGEAQSGVLSFQPLRTDCSELGYALSERGVAVRSGLHCAPLAHRTAGTLERGTVRLSLSPFTTEREIDTVCEVLTSLIGP